MTDLEDYDLKRSAEPHAVDVEYMKQKRIQDAAGDMLEALKACLTTLRLVKETPADQWSGLVLNTVIEDARAAIAKAEGTE